MSDLTTLRDNRLYMLACKFGKDMYAISEIKALDYDPALSENIRSAAMHLTTFLAEAHARSESDIAYHLIQNSLTHARELGGYLYLVDYAEDEEKPLFYQAREDLNILWDAFVEEMGDEALLKATG